jgi:CheY-like chemotaxis protein
MTDIKRILLVEDDPRDVELTLTALSESNLANDVFVVGDGTEALDFLFTRGKFENRPNGNPAVILLDLKLPKVDGLEVLRQIRGNETTKMIPVVIITSSKEEADLMEGYKLGTNAYVQKPIDFHQFIDAIKNLGIFWAIINEPPPGSVKKK